MKLSQLFESQNLNVKGWEKLSRKTVQELESALNRELKPTSGDCFIIATALFLKAKKLGKDVIIIGDNGPHAAIFDLDLEISIDGMGVHSYEDALQGRRTRTWKTISGFIKTAKMAGDESQGNDIDFTYNKYR